MIERILTVGGFTLLSRLTGFFRDIMLAAILGAGPVADAFFVAFRLPNHFRAIFAEGAFNAAFIPAYARIRTQGGPQSAALFGDRIFTLLIATQAVLLALALIFTPQVIELLAPGFSHEPQQFALAVSLTRITFPLSPTHHPGDLMGRNSQRAASLRGGGGRTDPAQRVDDGDAGFAAFFGGAGYAAAWGVLISGVLQAMLVGGDTLRAGVFTVFRALRFDADVRRFFTALLPATIGSAGTQLALFADTIIASFLATGAISALYYADRIDQLPIGVIGIAVGTVLVPEMTHRIAAGDEAGARSAQNRAIEFALLLAIPCIVAFLVVPDAIMRGLFMRGRFTAGDAHAAAMTLDRLHHRAHSVRTHSQRRRPVPRPRRHADADEGGADRYRCQHRLQDRADRPSGAGRACACDLDWSLDQFRAGAMARGACRAHRPRCAAQIVAGQARRGGTRHDDPAFDRHAAHQLGIFVLVKIWQRGGARGAGDRRRCILRSAYPRAVRPSMAVTPTPADAKGTGSTDRPVRE